MTKLNKKINIIFRKYNNSYNVSYIKKISDFCKKRGTNFYVANDFKVAMKVGATGVYLPSFYRGLTHNNYKFRENFEILGSAHNLFELNNKKKQKVDVIFLSPFLKKKKTELGIYGFLKLKKFTKKKVIALGGINKNNLSKVKLVKADGFAAIRYFTKKKGPLKRGLKF